MFTRRGEFSPGRIKMLHLVKVSKVCVTNVRPFWPEPRQSEAPKPQEPIDSFALCTVIMIQLADLLARVGLLYSSDIAGLILANNR
jgi:hypothetical protein